MEWVQGRTLGEGDQRRRVRAFELPSVRRRREVPRARHRGYGKAVDEAAGSAEGGTRQGRRARHGYGRRFVHHIPRPRLSRQVPREDRGPADRQAPQARVHAIRRHQDGRGGSYHLRLHAQPRAAPHLHRVPQDAQPGRVRRIHPRDAHGPQEQDHHRPARHIRTRPHRRRLSPRGPLRNRQAYSRQGARPADVRRGVDARGRHPRPRGSG